jgi:hypothetical protein
MQKAARQLFTMLKFYVRIIMFVKVRQYRQINNQLAAANSGFKKLAVQWLNEALVFELSSLLADSFRLQNRQLPVAAKRNKQP